MWCLRLIFWCLLSITLLSVCSGAVSHGQGILQSRSTSSTTQPPPPPLPPVTRPAITNHVDLVSDSNECQSQPTSPIERVKATMRVSYTKHYQLCAFIVFYTDEHLSEEPSVDERRLEYLSGWDGPGTGVVLSGGAAALWVPSGDVRRARSTVSCSWIIIDADDSSQPTIADWIFAVSSNEASWENINENKAVQKNKVGADARLASIVEWQALSRELKGKGFDLTHNPDLIDDLWKNDPLQRRPDSSKIVAKLHNPEYTGISWSEKVSMVRTELQVLGADAMVVTALDEVAWLLNVRGRDVPNAPLLKAFVIISAKELTVYAPPGKLAMPVNEALAVYSCHNVNNNCTRIKDYTTIYSDEYPNDWFKVLIPSAGTFQRGASAAIAQKFPENKRIYQPSPITYLKAQKNPAEVSGMRKAHLRDAVAMCTLISYLEKMIRKGLDELSVATKVDVTRATQAGFVGLSMRTRAAFGPNGADPDYVATNATNRRIHTNSTLTIISGGQYDEGTTVVTRTLHYGNPHKTEKRAYTTTLRALAALALLNVPSMLPATHVDPLIRAPLWDAKQDYPYPTGYGVGAALNRREDPVVIDYRQDANLHNFREGYFITTEPAWYEAGKFGIRLGNILEVVSKPNGYLGFTEATLIPFEPKLIELNMLTEYELTWLNEYNLRIRNTVGPELKSQGLMDVYYWMMNRTEKIVRVTKMKCNAGNTHPSKKILITLAVLAAFLKFSLF